jgi:hypothetical protein
MNVVRPIRATCSDALLCAYGQARRTDVALTELSPKRAEYIGLPLSAES